MTELVVNPYTITDIKSNALSLDQVEKLSTARILAYYKKYRKLRSVGQCECCGELLTKRDVELNRVANEYMDGIKAILDSREHVC